MTTDPKTNVAPVEIEDTALDAAVGAGDAVPTETVIFQFGAIPVRNKPPTGSDPDQPIVTGRLY